MTTIDTTAIAAKINARKEAEAATANARQHADEVLDLALSEAKRHGMHAREFFLRVYTQLGELLRENPADPGAAKPAAVLPPITRAGPMNDAEAARWGRVMRLSFGKHEGKFVKDVPIEYLSWLDDQNEFARELHRYLAAPSVAREIE